MPPWLGVTDPSWIVRYCVAGLPMLIPVSHYHCFLDISVKCSDSSQDLLRKDGPILSGSWAMSVMKHLRVEDEKLQWRHGKHFELCKTALISFCVIKRES